MVHEFFVNITEFLEIASVDRGGGARESVMSKFERFQGRRDSMAVSSQINCQ